ncbi:MAG: stage III sporulation protein AA [Bacillota bacterium]
MKEIKHFERFLTAGIIKEITKYQQENKKQEAVQEIRLRIGRPIVLRTSSGKKILRGTSVERETLEEIVQRLGGYSLYAFEESLGQGFLTIEGGHRVGFCGKAVIIQGKLQTLRRISSLNLRIAHEVVGCAEPFMPYLFNEEKQLCHVFLVSPPGCGKTTFLRDFIRLLSGEAYGYSVGVVDERSEIAAMHMGEPQMDLGVMSDVQEDCPKALGMVFLLRSMSPEVIAVDELGKKEDFLAVEDVLHSGVKLFATLHGENMEGILAKESVRELFGNIRDGRVIFLGRRGGVGYVEEIQTTDGKNIYGGVADVDSTHR